MDSPQRQERRDIRYPLQLPVSVKLAHKEMHARSENISLGGIMLSSAFLIPEGSTVEVAVEVAHLPEPGTQLSARGKVLRVQPGISGNFAVAIAFERPYDLGQPGPDSGPGEKRPRFPQGTKRVVAGGGLQFTSAWYTET
jgi:hypothetical protein